MLSTMTSQTGIDFAMETTLTVDDDGVLTFPPEFLEVLGWKEGDMLEWVDNKDGSFLLKKDEGI